MLERLSEKNSDKVRILKVDVSSDRQWAAKEKVRSIPTFQIYSRGKKLKQFSGAPPEKQLQQMIDQYASQATATVDRKDEDAAPSAAPEPTIKPMPKDWLPPGITKKQKP